MSTFRSTAPGVGSEEEQFLESLLNGDAIEGLPADLKRVASLLSAASAPARLDELAGLGAACAAHDRMVLETESGAGRKPIVIGVAAAMAAVLFGGVGAAYAGALPATIQDFAHRTIGVPSSDGGSGNPAGPGNRAGSGKPGAVVPGSTPSPGATGDPSTGGRTTAPGQEEGGKATPPGQIKRTTKATPPGQVDNPGKAAPPGQVQRTATSKPTQANGGNGGAEANPDEGTGKNGGKNQLAPPDGAPQPE